MRNAGIETFRFIAILAVVVIHAYPTDRLGGQIANQLARFAVPYFFVISGYLFYRKTTENVDGSFRYLVRYALKLTYIYLFWYLIFAYWPLISPDNWPNIAYHGLAAAFNNETARLLAEFKEHLLYYLLAGGRADHLWFLPSLGMAIALLFISIRLNVVMVGSVFALALYLMALLLDPYNRTAMALPFQMSGRNGPFFSSVFVFMGALIAKYNIRISGRLALTLVLAGALMHLTEVFAIQSLYDIPITSHDFVLGTLVFGIGVAAFAIANEHFGERSGVYRLGGMTLGIYTSHLLIIKWLDSVELMPTLGIAKVSLVTALSIVLIVLLSRTPILRRFV